MSKTWPLLLVAGAATLGFLISVNIPAAVVAAGAMLVGGLVWLLRKPRTAEPSTVVRDIDEEQQEPPASEPAMSRPEEREVDEVLAEIREYLDAAHDLETSYPGRSGRRPPKYAPTGSMSASMPEDAPARRPRAGKAMSKVRSRKGLSADGDQDRGGEEGNHEQRADADPHESAHLPLTHPAYERFSADARCGGQIVPGFSQDRRALRISDHHQKKDGLGYYGQNRKDEEEEVDHPWRGLLPLTGRCVLSQPASPTRVKAQRPVPQR